ncbi:MAG TPA: molybdate ABC transporter substrate-binding protein [Gammaproteobacteria bacterium]
MVAAPRHAGWRRLALALGCACLASLPAAAPALAQGVRVAAASSLAFVMLELEEAFRAEGGAQLRVSLGSSGVFARQIARGAPFDLFLSADEGYVERLNADGHARDAGSVYAIGRLVLFVPAGSPLDPAIELAELPRAHADGRLERLALAQPEHTPYGRAAREALQASAAWDALQPALVYGESVAQAARFATTGAAQAGLLAWSVALQPQVAGQGSYRVLPESLHAPLRQRMVLLRGASVDAEGFYAFLRGARARAIFTRHGFSVPGGG